MQINFNTNQPQFKAVNQRYYKWAKEDYSLEGCVSTEWLQRIRYDVALFKDIAPQDGIDTIEAAKKYMKTTDECIESVLEFFRELLP